MQKIELTHTHYRDLIENIHAYALRAIWYIFASLPVVLLPFIAEDFAYIKSTVMAITIGIGIILLSLARRKKLERAPFVVIFPTLFAFFVGVNTFIAGGSFDGFFGRDLGPVSVFGVVIAMLGMWFTFHACASTRDVGRYAVVFVGGITILAFLILLDSVLVNVSFSSERITPIAFVTLSACIAVLHATRARIAIIVAVVGSLASLILLVASGVSTSLLVVGIFISGMYGVLYIRELLHEIMRASTPRIGMLLGKQHFHRAGIATFAVFFMLITIALFPQVKNLLPIETTPYEKSVYASREETRAVALKILDDTPFMGGGFGFTFERAWQELFFTVGTDTIPVRGDSLFYEYIATGGIAGIMLWCAWLITLLVARARIKYAPRFYDHGWYAVARVSFVAVCAGVTTFFFLPVDETSLVFVFALMGIFAASYRRLTLAEADVEKKHAMQRKMVRLIAHGFVAIIALGVVLYAILHTVVLSRFSGAYAYGYVPIRAFLLEDIDTAMENFSVLSNTAPGSELVLADMNQTTSHVMFALEKYPHATVVYERAFAWFSTLGIFGIKGIDERVETITKTLVDSAPRNITYLMARAEVLVRLGRSNETLSLLASPELKDNDDARRIRIDALIALGRFDDAKKELSESSWLSESMYGKLVHALLFVHTGAYRDASVAFEKIIREYPDVIDGYVYLAETYHAQGDTIRARSVLERGSLRATKGNWNLFRSSLEQITSTSTMSR